MCTRELIRPSRRPAMGISRHYKCEMHGYIGTRHPGLRRDIRVVLNLSERILNALKQQITGIIVQMAREVSVV